MSENRESTGHWLGEAGDLPSGASKFRVSNSPTLDQLKAMFHPSIDSEIIDMIWHNSNEDGEKALGFLNEMSPVKPKQLAPAAPLLTPSKATTSWSKPLSIDPNKPFNTEVQSVRPKVVPPETKNPIVEVIKERVKKKERIMVIMRGVPGSGKSYLAHQIQGNGVVLSTDDYFYNHQGIYNFQPHLLSEAHNWNRQRTDREFRASTNPIVIDNTNLEVWELQPYVHLALR